MVKAIRDTILIAALYTTAQLPVFGGSYDYISLSVDPAIHADYGLAYPVTYVFSIPSGSSGLRVHARHSPAGAWRRMEEKTSGDFFNGVEAVRFDYPGNKAYISTGFGDAGPEINLRVTDRADKIVGVSYQGIARYYDNRDAVVTATGDDWHGGTDEAFAAACDAFAARRIWFSPAINPEGVRLVDVDGNPPDWSLMQEKINAGYMEPTSHGRQHLGFGGGIYAYRYSGTHTGADNEPFTLADDSAMFPVDSYAPERDRVANMAGWEIKNVTDGSSGLITSSSLQTATCSEGLSGGKNNVWNSGDRYLICRYDEEIGGSKRDLLANLDMPPLNRQGNREYVYAYVKPYGHTDGTLQGKVGEYKYIVVRPWLGWSRKFGFEDAVWAGTHYRAGPTIYLDYSGTARANREFDRITAAGGIAHLVCHPDWVDWSESGWIFSHLDHVAGRKNIWYVGYGHLYLYRFLDAQNKVTVQFYYD